jgi:hypothetical protein
VLSPDRDNLLDVMASVNEMESDPLMTCEWAQDHVIDRAGVGTEQRFACSDLLVHRGQRFSQFCQQDTCGCSLFTGRSAYRRWGSSTAWEVSKTKQNQLPYPLRQSWPGLSRRALVQPRVDSLFRCSVGSKQVSDDLLNTPSFIGTEWSKLRLLTVKSTEGEFEFFPQHLKIILHRRTNLLRETAIGLVQFCG